MNKLKLTTITISTVFIISCSDKSIEGNNLSGIGFYSSLKSIISTLEKGGYGYREHFMLGVAYRQKKDYKKAIFHFANSCFTYERSEGLRLFAQPVYQFCDGFHFKSAFYDHAVFEIADLFYLYREYEYVLKFIDLIASSRTALYRDAILLKSKAFLELKRHDRAISSLRDIFDTYSDTDSRSLIHIRIASVYEAMNQYDMAVKEYLKVIRLNARSWQAATAANRILEITPQSGVKHSVADKLVLSEALYHGQRYDDALTYLEALLSGELGDEDRFTVLSALIRNYLRVKERNSCDKLIGKYRKDSSVQRRLISIKADELWSMRQRGDALSVYRNLIGGERDEISRIALKRVGLHMARRRQAGYEGLLQSYIQRFPGDAATEYFLWLLAREKLRAVDYISARDYLEKALQGFPEGKYVDRTRFWLYKLYSQAKRDADAENVLIELIARNPGSSYAWTILERIKDSYKEEKLKTLFDAAIQNNNEKKALFYHTLLFINEKKLEDRNERAEKIVARWGDAYQHFEDDIAELQLDSDYEENLKSIEKYFAIGYLDAIWNEIRILPDERSVNRDKYRALSYFGKQYNNYYLAAFYTLELLKFHDIKENISLFSIDAIRRLFPRAFQDCVQMQAQRFKIDEQLVYSVMKAESLFHHSAVSPAGAVGLMQLMPRTARGIARDLKMNRYDLKDPCTSITFGVKYLSWLSRFFDGHLDDFIGGYNAGVGNIVKWKESLIYSDPDLFVEILPYDETRFYILRTRKFLMQYRLIHDL